MTIRVLVADDHAVVRQELRMFLALDDEIAIVGEACDGRQAVALAHELQPDVILLELADNGIGFVPSGSFPGHLGLKSMRERALAAGARFTLESAPGEGTRILVQVKAQG